MFRYETMWKSHEAWTEKITDSWSTLAPGYGVGDFRDKLLRISTDLSTWSRDTFGSIRKEMKQIKAKLEQLRGDPIRTGPTHAEPKLNERLVELLHREELMWRQRTGLEWLSPGDKNTRFFICGLA